MTETRWIATGLPGVFDFVDEAGTILGFVALITAGLRSYVIEPRPRPGHRGPFSSIGDHQTVEAACAHVEAEIARIYGGGSAA